MRKITFFFGCMLHLSVVAQNVGIGTTSPTGRLHISGNADTSQVVIDANSVQTNARPLIKLRNSSGVELIRIHSDDTSNTFMGHLAGRKNVVNFSSGAYNTFCGNSSGFSNVSGSRNAAFGAHALFFNTSGSFNTAIGTSALSENTTGNFNTAVGDGAMLISRSGNENVAVGFEALRQNKSGNHNIAIGSRALYLQSYDPGSNWESGNVAIGNEALQLNQPTSASNGIQNTAVGTVALSANTTGYDNTGIGSSALYSNSSGFQNTAVGRQALFYNIDGVSNTAMGYKALRENISGDYNTAAGLFSLNLNTTGSSNTGFGLYAGYITTSGNYNSSFGSAAFFNSGALDNTTCIGNQAGGVANVSDRIEIGNLSASWIGGQVGWSTYSDGRIKDNVTENVPGLHFITRLRPVTYNLNIHRQDKMVLKERKETMEWKSMYDIEKIKMTGFIAQEVEQAAKECNYDFSGLEVPDGNGKKLYSLRYSDFIMPLVKAVQEQQEIIKALQVQVEAVKAEIPMQIGKQQEIITALQKEIEELKKKIK